LIDVLLTLSSSLPGWSLTNLHGARRCANPRILGSALDDTVPDATLEGCLLGRPSAFREA